MKNPLQALLNWYVSRSSRFSRDKFEEYVDEVGVAYRCPVCGNLHPERPLVCEKCFYPLPIVGGSKPK